MKDTVQTMMIAMEIFYADQTIVTLVVFQKEQIAATSNLQLEVKLREPKQLEVWFYMNGPSKLHAAISSIPFFGLKFSFNEKKSILFAQIK